MNRPDVFGTSGIEFKLGAESSYMVVHGAAYRIRLVTPNLVQQFVASDHLPGSSGKQSEDLELFARHLDQLTFPARFIAEKIDLHVSEAKPVRKIRLRLGASQQRANSGHQFPHR